ncbi:MAG TPA: BamA/TamA family outer membrane protein [Steroidobacteraceae bacterium]|nr:BamA/TamA family outer membrane protein [Steroidobacteraceae bacterium]
MRFTASILITALLAAPAVRAADPQPYTLRIESTGHGPLDAALKASSQLESLRTSAPAGPFALIGRAGADYERLRTVLESFGYYESRLSITITGRALDDSGLPAALEALPAGTRAPVQINVETGPLYHLGQVAIDGEVSAKASAAFALKSGAPAVAADVIAAGERLLNALQEEGHAFAKVDDPIAYQKPQDKVLDVSFKATPGGVYQLGAIHFEGMKRLNEAFLQKRVKLRAGDPYSPSRIERARADLLALGTFSGISVRLPKEAEVQGGSLPVTFEVQERKRHAVSVTAAYSSDLGGSGGFTWADRNVFGNAELLTLSATITDWGGSDTTGLGYNLGAQLNKPDFVRPDQALQFNLTALKQPLIAYDQTAQIGGVTLSRKLSPVWNVAVGVNLEQEKIFQQAANFYNGANFYYTLISLPLTAKYDSTALANPLSDPLHGLRVTLSLAPTESLGHPNSTFVIFQGTASTYLDLARLHWTPPGRSVIALRGLIAEAHGAGQFGLPPDQRFYAGGSATVRGYKYQSVGPNFPNPVAPPPTPANPNPVAPAPPSQPIPTGGTDLVATGIEFRQRFGANFGAAAFVDAGKVSTDPRPFEGRPSVGYGAGMRYYTPIGPIRLDIALPVRRLPGGDAFEIYVGLGQAF